MLLLFLKICTKKESLMVLSIHTKCYKVPARLHCKANITTVQEVYVVSGQKSAPLGRPAIQALGLVARVETIDLVIMSAVKQQFPKLFQGLGEGEYEIRLDANTEPFALTAPRRISLPLMPKVKHELGRMEELGVISCVDEPTDWCAGMVVVPKTNGKVRICVDLTKLNKSVHRERRLLLSVEHTLGQLGGAKIFSKLNANSGFWQIVKKICIVYNIYNAIW